MGKHFALTFQLPILQATKQTSRTRRDLFGGIKAEHFGAAILVLLIATVLVYLVQVNNFATKGYEINRLQAKLDQLQDENNKLSVHAAELQSIQNIQNDPTVLNMVPATQMTYVQTTSLSEK